MAAFHGKQGKVTFATTAVSVMSNVAVTSATHWADHLAGYKDWTATVECDVEDTGFDPDIETDFIDQNPAMELLPAYCRVWTKVMWRK
jgi:hypothetical protein